MKYKDDNMLGSVIDSISKTFESDADFWCYSEVVQEGYGEFISYEVQRTQYTGPVRTLADMNDAEKRHIEQEYGAKITCKALVIWTPPLSFMDFYLGLGGKND